jgi:hypothetical protein
LVSTRGTRVLPLYANPSGVFVLHDGLPSVRDFEQARATQPADQDFWLGLPPPAPYMLLVSDPLERFLPFTLAVEVPTRGLYAWDAGLGSPLQPVAGEPAGDVPLFSTPQRAAAEGMAIVRASLFDPLADTPAARAIVEVRYLGQRLGLGIADDRGEVAVHLPYPPPLGSLEASPPGNAWPVEIRVAYAPGLGVQAPSGPPELRAVLAQLLEPAAQAWADSARTQPLTTASLALGQELIVRTSTTSRLLVTPAGSPP